MAGEGVYDAIKAFLELPGTKARIADPNGAHAVPQCRFENENFTPPNPPVAWFAMSITGVLYAQESIGADEQEDNRWDEGGRLVLSVFVRVGSGGSRSHGLAKQLANLFRGLKLTLADGSEAEFMDALIGGGGASEPEDGQWYSRNVAIDFRVVEAH